MKWFLAAILFSTQIYGATIGIIDTGFDLDHEFLRPKILKQETDEEIADPDLKKKLHGWNFHDNSHLSTPVIQQDLLSDILKYRQLKAKGMKSGLTPEEYEWYGQKKVDEEFRKELKKFKKHIHGTVVASIALREGENINIFPIRGLHIDVPVVAVESEIESAPESTPTKLKGEDKFKREIKQSLDRVNRKFAKICLYLSIKKINIVNASYGITYKNIATKFQEMYLEATGEPIPAPLLSQYIDDYFNDLYESAIKTIRKYPNILFVFSAGNSGLDNDLFHHYPSRVKLDNTIAVAATNGDFLASFSNYGKNKVDIGAPGVGIQSIIPRVYSTDGTNVFSTSSGTSMAAPYISNLAAQMLNANPKLKPWQIKKIIMETGDQKPSLEEKLISKSVANNAKALKAANLSREISIEHAIQLATLEIVPIQDEVSFNLSPAKVYEEATKKLMESIPATITPTDADEDLDDGHETEQKVEKPVPAEKPAVLEESSVSPNNESESAKTSATEEKPAVKEKKKEETKEEGEEELNSPSTTKSSSSLPKDPETVPQDKSEQLPSADSEPQQTESDQDHSNQTSEQSQQPSEDLPPSSSESQPELPSSQPQENGPSSQQ